MALYPVIMCGGAGTRLWPASRPSRPKQFIPLVGEQSTFQMLVELLKDPAFESPDTRILTNGSPALVYVVRLSS